MTMHTSQEESLGALLPLFLTSGDQECTFDLRPRTDGVKFIRGILIAIALCLPIWMLIFWLITRYF